MQSWHLWLRGIHQPRLAIAPNSRIQAKRPTFPPTEPAADNARRRPARPVRSAKKEMHMTLTKLVLPVAASVLFALPLVGAAADRGVNEVSGSLSYTDMGEATTSSIDLSWGYYLTPQHE